MSEAYLTNWALGSHFDDRDRFHDVALHEARVATERHAVATRREPGASFVRRLRLALGRPEPMDACDCAVAA